MASEGPKPRVLLVSLNLQPFFDESYARLIDQLSAKATIQRVKNVDSATRKLDEAGQSQLKAVLITDETLATKLRKPGHAALWDRIVQYARNGGTVVVMGHFSSMTPPLKIKPLFSKAGLEWASASYHRTTTLLNKTALSANLAEKLPASYSQKALCVENVAPGDVWYAAGEDSVVESRVFPPTSTFNSGEAAVALASVGNGKIGYLGDVNAEIDSDTVILGMCGLL